ncbi:MAG TPA: translocation protein TolB [Bacillus sp. (in: firmicutes)]|nr:translocation protein TolB [Bacillus sp. (in: firmicutes)]
MKKYLMVFAVLLFIYQQPAGAQEISLQVAFIRNGDVWVKMNNREYRLSYTGSMSDPQWSHSGEYLSFYRKGALYVRHLSGHRYNKKVTGDMQLARWSPTEEKLAYLSGGLIYVYDMETQKSIPVTTGADQFSWFPDGKRLLVTSGAKIQPDGWGQTALFEVPTDANLNFEKSRPFFVLPKPSDDFLAITTSGFKWSPNQKWISFIAVPTASWSADSNTICLLSADGKKFQKLGKMVNNEEWMHWAPKGAKVGFIDGEGRIATQNKKLTIKELAAMAKGSVTPAGYVDWDFTWHNNETITVSRGKEAEWNNNEAKRPLPSLYEVSLKTHEQIRITTPKKTEGDFHPIYLTSVNELAWIRSDRQKAFVWLGSSNGRNKRIWVRNVDVPTPYYDQYDWDEVMAVYEKTSNVN